MSKKKSNPGYRFVADDLVDVEVSSQLQLSQFGLLIAMRRIPRERLDGFGVQYVSRQAKNEHTSVWRLRLVPAK